jgi:acyl-CoA thioesterase FadM
MKIFYVLLIFPFLLQAQQITFPTDTLAYDELFNNRQFAAYDAQGKLHITYTGQSGTTSSTREIYYLKELSDGTYDLSNLTNNAVDDGYSTHSFDQNGALHIGYIGRDPGIFQIKYMNNVSGSFSEPVWITQGGLNKATPYSKVGPDSVVHFVYFTYVEGTDNAYYRKYDLRNSTLSNEITLTIAEAAGDFEASLDVDEQGKVHIVVKSGGAFGGPFKYYTDQSGSIQEVVTAISGNITMPRVRVKNGVVHMLYRLETGTRLHYTNNSGGTFSTPVPITPVGQRPSGYQNFAIDDSGNLYFIYQSSVTASGRGFYMIFGYNETFTDTLVLDNSSYLTRNSTVVLAKGNGEFAAMYATGASRNSLIVCDIFMKRGNMFDIVPVELENFTASASGTSAELKWITSTETNNYGFEIERSSGGEFINTGFIPGFGTTTEKKVYTYLDEGLSAGKYIYRLTQIDYDGTRNIAGSAEVEITSLPVSYGLDQNYPNPFNPSTTIKYHIAEAGHVALKVYDLIGNEIASLVNKEQNAGSYQTVWNADNHSSGVYFYTLQTGNFTRTKKLMLLK